MRRSLAFLLIIAITCVPEPAVAGSERESYTRILGGYLFFSWLPNDGQRSLVGFESANHLRHLHSHCQSGLPVHELLHGSSYRCSVSISKTSTGEENWSQSMIDILGPLEKSDYPRVGLFALRPAPRLRWHQQPLDETERAALLALMTEGKGPRLTRVDLDSAWSISSTNSPYTTYFVPGDHVRDEEAFYEAQRHHIFLHIRGGYRYQGRVPDKPTNYVDTDRNGIPEFITDESCDGMCVTLWSVASGPKALISFGGH